MRASEPCGHTVPMNFWVILNFFEKISGLPAADCFAESTVVKGACKQLQTTAARVKQSTHVCVQHGDCVGNACNENWSDELRQGICLDQTCEAMDVIENFRYSGPGPQRFELQEWLPFRHVRVHQDRPWQEDQTHSHVPLFLSEAATLSGQPWLRTGWELWNLPDFSFARDYMLPWPNHMLTGCIKKPADYAIFAACARAVFMELKVPRRRNGNLCDSETRLFVDPRISAYWSEHSERNWLTSIAAMMKEPKEHRTYLGRWGIGATVDEYVRTALAIVLGIQERAVKFLSDTMNWSAVNVDLDVLENELQESSDFTHMAREQIDRLTISFADLTRDISNEDLIQEADDEKHDATIAAAEQIPHVATASEQCSADTSDLQGVEKFEEDALDDGGMHIVTITSKRKLRRLHKRGVCGINPENSRDNF